MANNDKNDEEKNHRQIGEVDGYTVKVDVLAKAPTEDLAAVLKRRSQQNRRRRCGGVRFRQ
jgi:hypothetical protein